MRHRKKKKIFCKQLNNLIIEYSKTLIFRKKIIIKKKLFFPFYSFFFKKYKRDISFVHKKITFFKIGPRKGDKTEMICVKCSRLKK
ncbi:hypothetical protein ACWNX6_00830 [Candidatus Vidania fulgoroideorum]